MKYNYELVVFGTLTKNQTIPKEFLTSLNFNGVEESVLAISVEYPTNYYNLIQRTFEDPNEGMNIKINIYQNGYNLIRDISDQTIEPESLYSIEIIAEPAAV